MSDTDSRQDRDRFIQKIHDAIDNCGKLHSQIAEQLGYPNQNIISMFKSGVTRIPMVKVPEFARIVGLDDTALLREWFAAYDPEALPVIEAHFGAARGPMTSASRGAIPACISLQIHCGGPISWKGDPDSRLPTCAGR